MRSLVVAVSLALLLPAAAGATAKTKAPPARATVEQVLRAHDLGPTDKDLAALGAGVDEVLLAIAADAKADVLLRARAVSALAYAPTAKSRKFLEQTVAGAAAAVAPTDRLLARKAALALGWLSGPGVPALLAPLL